MVHITGKGLSQADADARYLNESSNLSDLDSASTARTNLGLVAGGAGDIWVEKAGDTSTGTQIIQVPTTTTEALILKTTDDNTTKNLFEVQDSGGDIQTYIDATGKVVIRSESDGTLLDIYSQGTGVYDDVTTPMSSNSAPSPNVASASVETGSNEAYRAFNHTLTDKWTGVNNTSGWLKFDFGSGNSWVAERYTLFGPVSGQATYAPKDWTFEGSNDDTNWTVLDTITGQTAWGAAEERNFTFTNSTAYRYYRLNISDNNGGVHMSLTQMYIEVDRQYYMRVLQTSAGFGPFTSDYTFKSNNGMMQFEGTLSTNTGTIRSVGQYLDITTAGVIGHSTIRLGNEVSFNGSRWSTSVSNLYDLQFISSANTLRIEARAGAQKLAANTGTEYQWGSAGSPFAMFGSGAAYFPTFQGATAATVPVRIKGQASQSASLQEWQDSSSNVLLSVLADGALRLADISHTPSSGDLWYEGGALHFQPESDERSVTLANGVIIADTTVANTVTETTIFTEGVSADELYKGSKWHTNLSGYYSTANASDTFTFRLKIGGTTILSVTSTAENVSDGFWRGDFFFTVRSTGASGTVIASFEGVFNDNIKNAVDTSTTTIDTTSAENITATIQWDASDVGNTLTITQGNTDIMGVNQA